MNRRELLATTAAFLAASRAFAKAKLSNNRAPGADMAWTSYQTEAMKTSGTVLGPTYGPFRIENEAINQSCVKLAVTGDYIEFTVNAPANALVVRYCLPDAAQGGGLDDALTLTRNGEVVREIALTSRFTWLYGEYPFSNTPADGKPRHFFDDARIKGLNLAKGDVVRLVKRGHGAPWCIIDLVDLEMVPPAEQQPAGALSLTDFGASGKGESDDTEALRALIAAAAKSRKIAFVPAGDYKLTGDIELPSQVTLKGAGIWHTNFVGDEALYNQPSRRLRFKLTGVNSHLADFALLGKVKYRNDSEQNDGIFGAGARDCTVSRLWVEHTKVGMWFYVCRNITIEGCRLRNTFADGINLCVDVRDSTIENCTARNTGDDCFAIWPAASDQGFTQRGSTPGNNVVRRCTGQAPFLAQGASLYGGASNRIEDCLFTDIGSGSGILISTTFETADKNTDNNFSGLTTVRNCLLQRCGGYDHGWTWRAAFQICLQRKDISGLRISDITIEDSLSEGLSIITPQDLPETRRLSDTVLERITVTNYGVGAKGRHAFWISKMVVGSAKLTSSQIGDVQNDSRNFRILAD
ncbi:MAG: glycosyl hydrolase family 28-related protein [Rhizomicrobium sp.]|nr:glycosyl hydrolase family 28-related protein [Rhizomicrobium sp.]